MYSATSFYVELKRRNEKQEIYMMQYKLFNLWEVG